MAGNSQYFLRTRRKAQNSSRKDMANEGRMPEGLLRLESFTLEGIKPLRYTGARPVDDPMVDGVHADGKG